MLDVFISKFDSEIFGHRVAKLYFNENYQEQLLEKQIEDTNAHTWFAFTKVSPHCIAFLEERKFSLISIRSLYRCDKTEITLPQKLNSSVRVMQIDVLNPPALSSFDPLVTTIASTSRYFRDPRIPTHIALRVYQQWFKNSLLEGYADLIFAAYDKDTPIGWLSLKIKEEVAIIDLIGILEDYQRGGIGNSLMSEAFIQAGNRVKGFEVITEGENIGAIRFYSQLGFMLESVELVYHKHED
jgi:GNAT superfamily N-acetyltransferase